MPLLLEHGYRVVATSRDPKRAARRFTQLGAQPELCWRRLDMSEPESFARALEGCSHAVYLLHGMGAGANYETAETEAAQGFLQAAEAARLRRVVYLGGVEPQGKMSRHLRSRLRTGAILRSGGVSTIELRAAMIIGGGCESWRIVRDLAERLPLMVLPRWLDSQSEPVAIADVAYAIERALELERTDSAAFALPGPEAISACEILRRTARLLGSNPRMLRIPVVTPRLSSYWIRLVTRANLRIAEELVEGLRADLRAGGESFWSLFPQYELASFEQAARHALTEEEALLAPPARALERRLRRLFGRPEASATRLKSTAAGQPPAAGQERAINPPPRGS